MVKTTARSRTRTARQGMLGVAILAAVAFGGTVNIAVADAPALTWKFTQGEALHYQMEQKTVTQIKSTGQDIKTTVNQTLDTTWNVDAVDKSTGSADMTQTIDRIRTKIETNIGSFEYDSKSEKPPEGLLAAGVVPMFKALVGSKFKYKISAQGELSDIQVSETLIKALKDAGSAGGGNGMFTEDGLKNMISESSLVLPKDVAKTPSWTRQAKIPSPPIGTMLLDKSYKYEGSEKDGEKIVLDAKIVLEPSPDFAGKLANQEGKGTFYFDSQTGRVVKSVVHQKIEMHIPVMNNEVSHTSDMTSAMKLLNAKSGGETK